MQISQNPLMGGFDLLESNSIYIFVHENQKIQAIFFSLDACSSPIAEPLGQTVAVQLDITQRRE